MDEGADALKHDDIWDDSALVESWNEALAEYKVRPYTSTSRYAPPCLTNLRVC